jgi:predicted ATPase
VVISGATYRLVQGLFECQDRGPQELKGISTPLPLYRVVRESAAQSRFEVAIRTGLTPLVGREPELGVLKQRWKQAKTRAGQVVLLSGEPGIGKSRLVQVVREQVAAERATWIEFRCSPYHQNSALYPIIDHLQRLLQFTREDLPATKLEKLKHTLSHYRFPQADIVPLLAALLSLPHPEGAPPITVSPQKQKEKTQAALVAWLVEEAEKTAVYCVWEDLHWADPSTLEVLTLFLDQVPTTRLLVLLTFRPEFISPWGNRSHLSHLTLSRLGQQQVREMVSRVAAQAARASTGSARTGNSSPSDSDSVRPELVEACPACASAAGTGEPSRRGRIALPDDLIEAVVARTDGVPLFVEELMKTVLESIESVGFIGSVGAHRGAPIPPLGIPATLQDALMARLDRLGPAKEIAQLGATLGREFSYELIHVVSPLDEATLLHGLKQLVEAELVYQSGLPPQARYLFKHALIQDTAYQSLLKSTRQQSHRQIAQVLEGRFPETVETQPELLAHHCTEAGLIEQAIPYWQKAGQRATQRSAHVEAISHLTKGLELLKTLPDTSERAQQELTLQITLGAPLIATKGNAVPEVEKVYTRALELCRRVGKTPQLFPVLGGLCSFYLTRGEFKTARELGEQRMYLAQSVQDPALLVEAHRTLGATLFWLGEFASARAHLAQGIALYDSQRHSSQAFLYVQDPRVHCLSYMALALWPLGYPDEALERISEALTLAQELPHSYSQAWALIPSATLHQHRREEQLTLERAEAAIALSTDQGFPLVLVVGTILQGWALTEQGQGEEGIVQICRGITAWRTLGAEAQGPHCLALLVEAYRKVGQIEEGLTVLAEALAMVNKNGERQWEAELYRLKGTLTLQSQASLGQVSDKSQASLGEVSNEPQASQGKSENPNPQPLTPSTQEAETCFHKAIEIARHQQAKSLELRAAMSLARLWQQQGKQEEAHDMLAEIYGWFTEGFDTADLQDAKALLEELS